MATLYEMNDIIRQLTELLEADEIDQKTFNDTVEGLAVDDKIDAYCSIIREFKGRIEKIKEENERLAARKKSFENSIDRLKSTLDEYLQSSNQTKHKTSLNTVYYSSSQSVNILDESKIPQEYFIPQKPKLDKKSLSSVLKKGVTIDGAELVKSQSVAIR